MTLPPASVVAPEPTRRGRTAPRTAGHPAAGGRPKEHRAGHRRTQLGAGLALPVVAAAVCLTGACVDWLGPGEGSDLVLVTAEQGKLALVAPTLGRVGRWNGLLPQFQLAVAPSPDGATVYWSAFNVDGHHPILLAVNVSSLRIIWQDTTTALMQRSQVGPIAVFANLAISPTPDGRRLLAADAKVVDRTSGDSTTGIAVLNMTTRDPVGFIGPLAVMAMAAVPPGPAYADGAVLVVGSRSTSPSSVGQLFVLDGATLAIRDSVTLVPSLGLDRGGFTQVVAAPDRIHVYAVAATGLYEYDLVARQVVATGPRLGGGMLAIAPDGQRLYLSDAGDLYDFPGSGKIFVYDAALHALPPFDLSAAAIEGGVPTTRGLTTTHDGRRLYAMSGSVFLGQLGRLFVLDTSTGTIVSTIALDAYGVGWILLR